jgi:6-phosphofructokinase 1
MANSSTKVFLLEVMGRHAGWLAASAGIIKNNANQPPHIILLPEVIFNEKKFLKKVNETVKKSGYCVIVASEGIKNSKNQFISASNSKDDFGHAHLGGVAPKLASMIMKHLKQKVHWAVSDYLQRAARHIASKVDVDQAYAIGYEAIKLARKNKNGIMLTIERRMKSKKYSWSIGSTKLENVANKEKILPRNYIGKDGFSVTTKCKNYIKDLVMGEDYPKYKKGVPDYAELKHPLLRKKLKKFNK